MATSTQTNRVNPEIVTSRVFAEVFQAYAECSDEVQEIVRQMVTVVNDPEATESERAMACSTIADSLFPFRRAGHLGIELGEAERLEANGSEPFAAARDTMDEEEENFAARVLLVMKERGMNQASLAEACGVGQPALSNLLSRGSRPQRRTVEKLAAALSVRPEDLWPV